MLQLNQLKVIKNAISVFDILDEEKPPRVVFTTQRDNRVDDSICLPLAGIAFDIDSPFRPIIPDDTHPNCRCYYVDEVTGQIVTDISSRRDIKRRSELTDRQRKNIVRKDKKYLTQKKRELIDKNIKKQQKWQSDSKKFKEQLWQYDLQASLEQIFKWVRSI
jgi:hypothetical protein